MAGEAPLSLPPANNNSQPNNFPALPPPQPPQQQNSSAKATQDISRLAEKAVSDEKKMRQTQLANEERAANKQLQAQKKLNDEANKQSTLDAKKLIADSKKSSNSSQGGLNSLMAPIQKTGAILGETLEMVMDTLSPILDTAFSSLDTVLAIMEGINKLKDLPGQFAAMALEFGEQSVNVVDDKMTVFGDVMTDIDARLQGTGKRFYTIHELLDSNLMLNPFVSLEATYDNLATLVKQGVSYNVEQRSFLMTVSDRIAQTFDVFDSNLLKLIRIQQADTTGARMAMEASLTRFFNMKFDDSSYLNEDYDTVSQNLLGAISQLGRDEGLKFEYIVQKWLGSLSSVGFGSDSVSQIAKGINSLVVGDIEALSSDPALYNLMVLSANRAGVDIGSALTNGINSKDANKILEAVVEQLQSVADSDNQVIKAQYAKLLGVSISDFASVLNLTSRDLKNISKATYSYTEAMAELNYQLTVGVAARTHMSTMLDTLYENAMLGVASDISSSPVQYMTWKSLSLIKDLTGDIEIPIPIPFVGVYELGLISTLQQGIIGLNLMGNLLGALTNLGLGAITQAFGGNGFNAMWHASEYTKRGSGFSGIDAGADSTTSFSAAIGNQDSSRMQEDAISSSTESTKETADDNTDEDSKDLKDIWELTNSIIHGSDIARVRIVNGSGSSTVDPLMLIYDLLKDWDYDGLGVKAISITPNNIGSSINGDRITVSPNGVITKTSGNSLFTTSAGGSDSATVDNNKVTYNDKDLNAVVAIYELLSSLVSNDRLKVATDIGISAFTSMIP